MSPRRVCVPSRRDGCLVPRPPRPGRRCSGNTRPGRQCRLVLQPCLTREVFSVFCNGCSVFSLGARVFCCNFFSGSASCVLGLAAATSAAQREVRRDGRRAGALLKGLPACRPCPALCPAAVPCLRDPPFTLSVASLPLKLSPPGLAPLSASSPLSPVTSASRPPSGPIPR